MFLLFLYLAASNGRVCNLWDEGKTFAAHSENADVSLNSTHLSHFITVFPEQVGMNSI